MDPTWAFLMGVIAAVIVLLVAVALIPTLLQIRRTAQAVEEVALRLKVQIDPTLSEAQGLVRDVASLTRQVDSDMKAVSRVVSDVADTAAYAKSLAGLVRSEVERPMLGLISTIVGLRRGLDAFRNYRESRRTRRARR